jgi:DNA-binding transcriptional regulator PaaX
VDNFLVAVGLVGLVGLTVVAPNSLVALEKPLDKFLSGREKKREAERIAKYLKQQKLVSVIKNNDDSYQIVLADKGEKRSKRASFERLAIPTTKWDKKWRIIMFDIPEKHKTTRDYISSHLRRIGFWQLQRSVFIYPYPVDEFAAILRDIFPELGRNLVYLVTDDIDQHNLLVKKFSKIL